GRGGLARGVGHTKAQRGERLRLGPCAVVAGDGVPGREETLHHGRAHGAEAHEPDRAHAARALGAPPTRNIAASRPSAALPMASIMRSMVGGMRVAVRRSRKARSTGNSL